MKPFVSKAMLHPGLYGQPREAPRSMSLGAHVEHTRTHHTHIDTRSSRLKAQGPRLRCSLVCWGGSRAHLCFVCPCRACAHEILGSPVSVEFDHHIGVFFYIQSRHTSRAAAPTYRGGRT